MFGSTANRLALKGSDIDLLVIDKKTKLDVLYNRVFNLLKEQKIFEYVVPLSQATVPIIKILHKETGINLDIVFNREDGLQGLAIVIKFITVYPELKPLYFVLKAFLKYRKLDQTYTGGISSFMLVNMIVFYLQNKYKIYLKELGDKDSLNIGLYLH
jgi:non-canonical poly(A) RNA polymerase PAPD5/7